MKNIIFKLGLSVILLFSITCCMSPKHTIIKDTLGVSMVVENINGNSQFQVDSIIKADTLPSFNKWLHSSFVDYNTNERILKRMCIKRYNDGTEIIYIVVGKTEPFKISKRITR